MNLSLPRSISFGAIVGAVAWTSLTIGAAIAPTQAYARAGDGPFYTAELSQPATKGTAIAGGVAWSCEGTTCTAAKGTSRALRVCRDLNREVGPVSTFTAKGEELNADDLARCNN